ncbi:glucan endo-1,3-beta-glucosidase 12-like isoform X2 [Asparagus officinalis]|uniref:glucan endo-1,3-beta-glucosidase 12-like isoform X2 n=1 Tax=Asparagus officinalis TaxID=4686 RepID=UPI00098E4DEB|nr:glucan endo-1,3-beta-glucosidase 12-like isoform X2 [Asparagus officinalis]
MAGEQTEGKSFFVALLLIFSHVCNCSGTSVGFSYDATQNNFEAWSPEETLAFVQKNNISSQFRVFHSKAEAYLDSFSNTQIPINFFLNPIEPKSLISWLETHTLKHLPRLNINTIVVNTTKHDFTSLLHIFNSIHSVLEKFDLDEKIEVSFRFSLSDLEKNLPSMMRLVNKTNSSIFIETFVGRDRNLGDGFVHSVLERALYICSFLLPYPEIPLFLNVKSSIVPSGAEMAEFTEKLEKSIDNHPEVKNRISALFIDISSISKAKFLDEKTTMIHDIFPPITVPSTEPPPNTVTIPPTNPATFPTNSPITNPTTNPTTTSVPYPYPNPTIPPPITYPYTNPTIPPFTSPATNPTIPPQFTNPTTNPVTYPVTNPTNPVTTPITNPVNQPVTNPVTTYPFPPPTGTVPVTPATAVPTGTVPVTPVVGSGQTWCVARSDVPENALQNALDYACGIGGVDCSAIQMTGGCYNPNSLQAHASYAFNSYYQRNPVPSSCDFGGTATLVTTNPSSGTCNFPSSSSSGSSVNPSLNPGINPGQNPGMSPGLNPGINPGMNPGLNPVSNPTYGSGTGSTVFGSDNPTGSFNRSSSVHPGVWILFAIVFTVLKLIL